MRLAIVHGMGTADGRDRLAVGSRVIVIGQGGFNGVSGCRNGRFLPELGLTLDILATRRTELFVERTRQIGMDAAYLTAPVVWARKRAILISVIGQSWCR